jgi:hypothetical protein
MRLGRRLAAIGALWVAALCGLVLGGGTALAQEVPEVPVEVLVVAPVEFSDTEISVTGELIGDYGHRRDGTTWTQLNDDGYATGPLREGGALSGANVGIGLRLPRSLAEGLDAPGGYLLKGPLVTATGIWKYHDPDRGGESYLDVTALEIVEPGRALTDDASVGARLAIGGALWLMVAAIWFLRRRLS